MESMKQTLENLYKRKQTIRILLAVWAVIAVLCAVLAFGFRLVIPALVVLIADMVFYFAGIHRMTQNYGYAINRANIIHGFCRPFKNVTYSEKGGMTLDEFVKMQFLPVKIGENTLMSRNDFSGDAWEMHVEGHELTFHYVIMNAKKKSELRFVSGSMFTAHFSDSDRKYDWLLIRNDLLDKDAQMQFIQKNNYVKADMGENELSDAFTAYTHEGSDLHFPEALASRIYKAGGKANNISAFRLTDEYASVFLTRRFYAGSRYTTTEPTEEILSKNYFPERDEIFGLLRFCRELK